MHIHFTGIGGVGIGPLAMIAKQAGYEVSGSDSVNSQYLEELKQRGIADIYIGQNPENISAMHTKKPIDWLVHSSAVRPDNPELSWAQENGIKVTKRDEFTNKIISDKNLKLIAVAGTHGKTTTTAMLIWLLRQLGTPISYSLGAKLSFGDMGHYHPLSEYFIYECDEFDRNFLAFHPFVAIISGVAYDHHEIYPTLDDYKQAFRDFIAQSEWVELWQEDKDYLKLEDNDHHAVMDSSDPDIEKIKLPGKYNRQDAWLAIKAVRQLSQAPLEEIKQLMDSFPGLHRRMEQLVPGLYTDEAHTPEKIRGAMSAALETAQGKPVVVVYEPLTNRRQHYLKDDYKDCFVGAKKVYWLPSYLAREDPNQVVLTPQELITHLSNPALAEAAQRDDKLKVTITQHINGGDVVVGMAGGGGGSLDEWLRQEFKA